MAMIRPPMRDYAAYRPLPGGLEGLPLPSSKINRSRAQRLVYMERYFLNSAIQIHISVWQSEFAARAT